MQQTARRRRVASGGFVPLSVKVILREPGSDNSGQTSWGVRHRFAASLDVAGEKRTWPGNKRDRGGNKSHACSFFGERRHSMFPEFGCQFVATETQFVLCI